MSQTQSTTNYIKSRLSLRKPQAESLDRLDKVLSDFEDLKTMDLDTLVEKISEVSREFRQSDFNFPSMCFALATGVGKTRLMGAIIYYLYKAKNIRNFFVIAPNLTIYNKLRQDFSYGSPKYVFKGLEDVNGQNPLIIDGDNYSDVNHALNNGLGLFSHNFTVNIFNISKFNSKKDTAKMKNFSEYIGESYYEYLQGLDDLVVLMDESHRYRADSSASAINELKPLMGFEFTATPFTIKSGRKTDFNNIFYRYNLANALQDGYVKTPWVATRSNVDVSEYSAEALDFLKITDGIAIHERTKVDLQMYADNNKVPYVKPFMMISAKDQAHADYIESLFKSDIKDGKYKDKVITIYSNGGADMEENIQKLLEIEKPENPIEIVIQVMMLKEGWDVKNLYTIVPLRASASEILTEQTIGRGLRLPYGERVGEDAIDRLTIVAHDKYQAVVDEANKPDSLVRNVINLDEDNDFTVKLETKKAMPKFLDPEKTVESSQVTTNLISNHKITKEEAFRLHDFTNATAVEIVENNGIGLTSGNENAFKEKLINEIKNSTDPNTKTIFGKMSEEEKEKYVEERTIEIFRDSKKYEINIPRVSYFRPDPEPKFDTNFKINPDFLSMLTTPDSSIQIKKLIGEGEVEKIKVTQQINFKGSVRDYFVFLMMDGISELDYGEYASWMYSMADDLVAELVASLGEKSDDEYKVLVDLFKKYIVQQIRSQILSTNCYSINIQPGEFKVNPGSTSLKTFTYSYIPGCSYDFKNQVEDKSKIKSYIFYGFNKTSANYLKFDSDAERRLAVCLENDDKIEKWVRPKEFKIDYYLGNERHSYEPDFIAESEDGIYIIEPKDATKVADPDVLAKKEYAIEWINAVNDAIDKGEIEGKKWNYLLLADTDIKENYTLDYMIPFGK